MQRREEGGAVRVHRAVDEGHEVEVADAGDIVTRGQRATDEQVADPAQTGQLPGQLADDQRLTVVGLLSADVPEGAETIGVLEHYARAAWTREDLSGDANTSIRANSDEQAAEGPEAARALVSGAREQVATALAGAPSTVYLPWQGWALDTDDFLVTRLMEMVVHADDLAASVEVPVPEFGPGVLDPVFRLLTALSVRRHGQDALVRALTRPQRAPATVAAF